MMKKLFFGIGLIGTLMACQQEKSKLEICSEKERINVKVAEVNRSQHTFELSYSGTIEASKSIPLTFQSSEIVKKVYVEEGDYVRKDQLLAEVEKTKLVSANKGALAQYEEATDAQVRLKTVYDKGSLPEIKWMEIKSKVAQAKSLLELTERNLDNCELRSPSKGYIGKRSIEVGMSSIQIEAPIILVNLDTVLAKISVPENEISSIEKGQVARIGVSALGEKFFKGHVERVGVVANQLSRTYDVKIIIENSELRLKPGMVCEVTLLLNKTDNLILIPMQAVFMGSDNQTYVYVVNPTSTSVKKRKITIGNIIHNEYSILSGLSDKELIVVQGQYKITENSIVTY